jgi:hypothetical protein
MRGVARLQHAVASAAAKQVLKDCVEWTLPVYASRPYVRNRRLQLSHPRRIGWHYVVTLEDRIVAITVGHGRSAETSTVRAGMPADSEHAALAVVTALPVLHEKRISLAILDLPEGPLRALWVRHHKRSSYWVIDPSHPEAPRGVLLTRRAFEAVARKLARQRLRRPYHWRRAQRALDTSAQRLARRRHDAGSK